MPSVSRKFNVQPPPRVVVDYLKDFGNAVQWDPGTQSCERVDSGPVSVGACWHNVSKIFGFTAELTYKLEELSDRRMVFVGKNNSATSTDTITVDPAEAGSAITYVADLDMHGVAMLLNPVMKLAFEKIADDTVKQLTTVLNQLMTTRG
ncbi:MAG: SRPBCC family protein [Actinomycetia bacterium]|nr:SRPBCC family protein [Actinomycetes bacterium]